MTYRGLSKIISGGQTGADQAGLVAGRNFGLLTGGTAPLNFMTSIGPNLLLQSFGLVAAGNLSTRTRKNIIDSQATVILGADLLSRGSAMTRRACVENMRPYLDIDIAAACATYGDTGGAPGELVYEASMSLCDFVIKHEVRTLNVAGNRERMVDFRIHYVTLAIVSHAIKLLDLEDRLIRDSDL